MLFNGKPSCGGSLGRSGNGNKCRTRKDRKTGKPSGGGEKPEENGLLDKIDDERPGFSKKQTKFAIRALTDSSRYL
jgi:sRNA-binding protein